MFLAKLMFSSAGVASHYLGDPLSAHRLVYSMFGETHLPRTEGAGQLFRVDNDSILIQSQVAPDLSIVSPVDFASTEFKKFAPVYRPTSYQFLIRSAPYLGIGDGKKRPLEDIGEIEAWLLRKGALCGFMPTTINVLGTERHVYGHKELKLSTALIAGALSVQNPDLFAAAVRSGIGKGKAYGCGLLSVRLL